MDTLGSDVMTIKTYPIDGGSRLSVHTIAAIRLPGRDVGETLVTAGVDPGVQEPEYGLTGTEARVVEKRNDGGGELCSECEQKELFWRRSNKIVQTYR
jgi:hypothetical protein